MTCIALLLGISVMAVVFWRAKALSWVTYSICFLISLAALTAALFSLLSGSDTHETLVLPLGLPWIGAHFRIDALAAFFLAVVNLGGMAASFYALGYGRNETAPGRILPFFAAFIAGMNLVILADDAFTFLLSWEFMSLTSWALVMSHHQVTDNAKAGYVYIVMASFGTLALLIAFGLLVGPEGSYAFDSIRESTNHVPWHNTLVLFLVLLGAGSKAGIVPLHVWLPLAHPAAPSHVSALMSGVMTKVAVYGFIRIVFDLLGGTDGIGSAVVIALAGITAVMGVLYALMQHDLKRLLAYHTVENIGIIFIGLGLTLAFKTYHMDNIAALAFTAALFHVFNHSVFKSLLFFGSGAVQVATGERDMERMGGLIHRMPKTALVFLIGCAAISALPPLNGFVSEWLMFQAILQGPVLPLWGLKILIPAAGMMLALSAALAAACFVKAFGITFLGRPRSAAAEQATETDGFSLSTMYIFALLCLLAGVLPGFIIDGLGPVAHEIIGSAMPSQAAGPWLSVIPIAESRSSYNGMLVFIFFILVSTITSWLVHHLASAKLRRAPAWDCGFPNSDPVTQYTAGSFAQPIRRVFGAYVFRASESVDMPHPGSLRPAHFKVRLSDLIWEWLYMPMSAGVIYISKKIEPLHFLTIQTYLSLVFAFLVFLLMVLAICF
jgi:formate hydrogenlyase subunit 3/multisubunit Na+/H+ antiporter MnhD subunit